MALTRPRASQIYDIDYKQATRVVTVTNISLVGGAPNQVDGVNLSVNDRILVTGQGDKIQNGIYYVSTLGSGSNGTWTRSSDTDVTGELLGGTIVMVTQGVEYADTQWKLITDDPIIIGTTQLTFTQNYLANSISSGTSNVNVASNANVTVSSAGTANVLTISNTGAFVSGVASVTGNITGNYFIGNGSQLTGLAATYGNANVVAYAEAGWAGNIIPSANVTYSLGNATNQWASAYIGANTLYINNVAISVNSANGLTVAGANVTTQNANGNITAGNVSTTGNITGGNITTAGLITATGNVTGNYFIGNGSQLTGVASTIAGNITVGTRTGSSSFPLTSGFLLVLTRSGNANIIVTA